MNPASACPGGFCQIQPAPQRCPQTDGSAFPPRPPTPRVDLGPWQCLPAPFPFSPEYCHRYSQPNPNNPFRLIPMWNLCSPVCLAGDNAGSYLPLPPPIPPHSCAASGPSSKLLGGSHRSPSPVQGQGPMLQLPQRRRLGLQCAGSPPRVRGRGLGTHGAGVGLSHCTAVCSEMATFVRVHYTQ